MLPPSTRLRLQIPALFHRIPGIPHPEGHAMNSTSSAIRRLDLLKVTLSSIALLSSTLAAASADLWEGRAPCPGARAAHSGVWTGREMILWGGGIDGSF